MPLIVYLLVPSELPSMDNLFEDLHWLLLISAYLLADESDGETPLIPTEIISYSASLKGQVDVRATFQCLCASQSQNQGKYYSVNQLIMSMGTLSDGRELNL